MSGVARTLDRWEKPGSEIRRQGVFSCAEKQNRVPDFAEAEIWPSYCLGIFDIAVFYIDPKTKTSMHGFVKILSYSAVQAKIYVPQSGMWFKNYNMHSDHQSPHRYLKSSRIDTLGMQPDQFLPSFFLFQNGSISIVSK